MQASRDNAVTPAAVRQLEGPAAAERRCGDPTTGDMLNALGRCIARLELEAEILGNAGDYACEFPASDAEALRAVVQILGGDRASRVQFQHPPDPMEAPLPCQVNVGHIGFGKGVPLRLLVEQMKRMYRLAHGQDADEVANEPLEARRARGDALLQRLRGRAAALGGRATGEEEHA